MANLPSGTNNRDNPYYLKPNHIKIAKEVQTKAEYLGNGVSISGLVDGEARPGAHGTISAVLIGDPGPILTHAWGSTLDGTQYGTGVNPTDYTSGDGGTLYLTVTTALGTYRSSAPIRYASGTNPSVANQTWTIDDSTSDTIDGSASGANLTFSGYQLSNVPSGTTINATSGLITVGVDYPTNTPSSGTATVSCVDQYGRPYSGSFNWTTAYRAAMTGGVDLDLSFAEGVAIPTTNLIQNWTLNGNTPTTLVSISPSLPAGLSAAIVGSAVNMTGTPTTATADATYTITVADEYGRPTADTFTLEITAVAAMTSLDWGPQDTSGSPYEIPVYLTGLNINTDGDWVITTTNDAPTAQRVRDGQDYLGATAPDSGTGSFTTTGTVDIDYLDTLSGVHWLHMVLDGSDTVYTSLNSVDITPEPAGIADDFNRPDETLAADANWTQIFQTGAGCTIEIVSNQIEFNPPNLGGTENVAYTWEGSVGSDQYAELEIVDWNGSTDTGMTVRLLVREQGLFTDNYHLQIKENGDWRIQKRSGGSNSNVANGNIGAFGVGHFAGDVFKIDAVGTSSVDITVYRNGVSFGSYTDSSSPHSGGKPGIYFQDNLGNAFAWDNFDTGAA